MKVRQDKRIINKSVYVELGIDLFGRKDVLGLWTRDNEGAKFWLNNLTELKNRGLANILIACTGNLTGMSDAIAAVYPKCEHPLCIVHQIRNSLKFVSYKDRKELAADLKPIYKQLLKMKLNLHLNILKKNGENNIHKLLNLGKIIGYSGLKNQYKIL